MLYVYYFMYGSYYKRHNIEFIGVYIDFREHRPFKKGI
jgi:hypothetical protein